MFKSVVERFFYIDDGDTFSYGGNQSWFNQKGARVSGCGPTAAANIVAYYGLSRGIEGVIKKSGENGGVPLVEKGDFAVLMDIMNGDYIKQSLGKSLNSGLQKDFTNGILDYFSDLDIRVKTNMMNDISTLPVRSVKEFIQEGLEGGNPVALLLWQNSYRKLGRGYSRHWMTVTGMDGDFNLTVSARGRKQTLKDFRNIWEEEGLHYSAFLTWFELR